MKRLLTILLFLFTASSAFAAPKQEKTKQELLDEESRIAEERAKTIAEFYQLPEGQDIDEITSKLLDSSFISKESKDSILASNRRIFVFEYPSDGFKVKGFISMVPNASENPILLNLRGGNRKFAMPSPGSDIAVARNYTVISTVYRGGISEGTDEFGGAEVNDVENLLNYIPILEEKIGEKIKNEKLFILGSSRGGMEMFLALARSPELQQKATKIISLSGLSDLRMTLINRPDMKEMFIHDFGLIPGENDEEWLDQRDPMVAVDKIRKDLPILMVAGTDDIRVELPETYNLVQKLTEEGHNVEYIEVPGGDHCLGNQNDRLKLLLDWLEQ